MGDPKADSPESTLDRARRRFLAVLRLGALASQLDPIVFFPGDALADEDDWWYAERETYWALTDAVRLDYGFKPRNRMPPEKANVVTLSDSIMKETPLPLYELAERAIQADKLQAIPNETRTEKLVKSLDYIRWRANVIVPFRPMSERFHLLLARGEPAARATVSREEPAGQGGGVSADSQLVPEAQGRTEDLRAVGDHAEKASRALEGAIWLLVHEPQKCFGKRGKVTAEKIAEALGSGTYHRRIWQTTEADLPKPSVLADLLRDSIHSDKRRSGKLRIDRRNKDLPSTKDEYLRRSVIWCLCRDYDACVSADRKLKVGKISQLIGEHYGEIWPQGQYHRAPDDEIRRLTTLAGTIR